MKKKQHEKSTLEISQRTNKPHSIPECWPVMSFYERFEHIVVIILSFVISIVVLFALLQLVKKVFSLLLHDTLDPMDHHVFQVIFGMIMTLLIAMEFKHSILKVLERHSHIVQAKAVILIALLALTRKFIVINFETTEPFKLIALGFSVLVLGGVYWLLNQQDTS
jgi:uncharacterized membrane protein (DUF373 family)